MKIITTGAFNVAHLQFVIPICRPAAVAVGRSVGQTERKCFGLCIGRGGGSCGEHYGLL